ncbi:MAG TPA: hypothetical protein PKL70_07105 [Saprospiraceae bacterium]|nr:hypothetical protein [Saprospiraceae bacterium]
MKNFIKNIFNKDKKEVEKVTIEPLTENQKLEILGDSISDVGYWSWWTTDLPKVIQIEFGGTQLYFPPSDNSQPPNSQIAIQFINPKSISFLTREELKSDDENWFDDLHNDKMGPPTCSHGEFTFTDQSLMTEIINDAKTIKTIHGYSPKDNLFQTETYKLVFWAGDYGVAVSSDEIRLLTKDGEIKLDQIPSVHSQWWTYWRKYWDLINTKNALPKDYACEVTIPLKND